tara:strand:- start:307 stop:522 length:216 start_codon:yes stop_codon:yes gene_type:complete
MGTLFSLIKVAGAFFLNSWLTMLFVDISGGELGLSAISYTSAMLVTIGIWVVIAPIVFLISRFKFSEEQTW